MASRHPAVLTALFFRFAVLAMAFACSAPPLLNAQDPTGDWFGLLDVAGVQQRLVLHVDPKVDGHAGTLSSADFGWSIELDEISFREGRVRFRTLDPGREYEGAYDARFAELTGTYKSPFSGAIPLTFRRTMPPAPVGSPPWLRERLDKQEVYVTMRDGARLFTSIYTPKDTSRAWPIILQRTPYSAEDGGADQFSWVLTFEQGLIESGYIFVLQDVRGRHMSEGNFVDERPFNPNKQGPQDVDENSDTWDTIEWLVGNVPHNNGKVGMKGVSYLGTYSSLALPEAHPALKAVSPQGPGTNSFLGDDWHHNGAFFLMDAFSFFSWFGRPRPEPTRDLYRPFRWKGEDNYEFFLDLGPIKNVEARFFGDSIRGWREMMRHPDYDDFWKAMDPRPHLTKVRPAVLVVGGWFDAEDLWGTLATYRAIEHQNPASTENRLLMGPWLHGEWEVFEGSRVGNVHWGAATSTRYLEMIVAFFDHWLKGAEDPGFAEATVFDTGALEWFEFDHWPPPGVTPGRLYLQPDGGLAFSAPGSPTDSYDEYVADPARPVPYTEDVHRDRTWEYMTDDQRFAARRPDVMVYESGVLTDPVTIAGPLEADLWVSTTGTDADYVVKIIDVFPDTLTDYPSNEKSVPMAGYQMLVRGEVLRGRYRNSFEDPEPFVPGEVTNVRFVLPDVMHTFKPGHRIMIQVQNSWFPLVDRNPQTFVNIYEADEEDFQKATHRIYHDAMRPSGIRVKLLRE
jgi:putative CocE/NonD family hydrolase